MFYLGIDQHKRQLTVNVRREDGSVVLKCRVSTQCEKVRAVFADLAEKARPEDGFLAILEVCGMNPWLLEMRSGFFSQCYERTSLKSRKGGNQPKPPKAQTGAELSISSLALPA